MAGIPLTLSFPKPGFFINDPRLTVWFNGHPVYDGSFLAGFETTFEVLPGTHSIVVQITTGLIDRRKQYSVPVAQANGYLVQLSYSRFWGNFSGAPRITPY